MQTIGDMYANASEKAERSVKSRLSCCPPGGVPGGVAARPGGVRSPAAAGAPAAGGGGVPIIQSVSLQLSGIVRSVGDPLRRFHAPDRFGVSSAAQLA